MVKYFMDLTKTLSKDLEGKLLIAPPVIMNTFWRKTVIMITEHDKRGSIGLIINKPSPISVADLGKHVNIDLSLPGYAHIGGPVSSQVLSIIHTTEWSCLNTAIINDNFAITSSNRMLSRFENGDMPMQWRIIAGMCSWGSGQLQNELVGKYPYSHKESWCIASASDELVFDYNEEEQWKLAIEQSGIDFASNLLI